MSKDLIYWAKPVNLFNTELEGELENILGTWFGTSNIIDPNQRVHADGYEEYKSRYGDGMMYYRDKVLPMAEGGVIATSLWSNKFTAGVAQEFDFIKNFMKRPGYLLYPQKRELVTATSIPKSMTYNIPDTRSIVHDFDYYGNKIRG